MKHLYAWNENNAIGEFYKDGGYIGFSYVNSPCMAISASMIPGAKWPKGAPRNFLENLLPETPQDRKTMALRLQAKSSSIFDLLDRVDSSGGIIYSESQDNPYRTVNNLFLASDKEIGDSLRAVAVSNAKTVASIKGARYSIAGMQPKVTLCYLGGVWSWPSLTNPSTHILKLDMSNARSESTYAVSTMRLAGRCGLPVSRSGIHRFGDTPAFVTERFDRYVDNTGQVRRLHTEDFAQMLGRSYRDKYYVSINAILKKLRTLQHYAAEDLQEAFLKQLMFNCCVGNADAHAKNYSILYTPAGIRLAPIYDVVPTVIWGFKELAMKVATVHHSAELSPRIWQLFARRNGLPEEETVSKAVAMSNAVRENFAEAFGSLPKDQLNTAWEAISYANSNMWK